MVISWRTAFFLLLVSALIFSATYLETRETVVIPFTSPSGYSGILTLDLPARVFTGDLVMLSSRVTSGTSLPSGQIIALAGRLEAGFEEFAPTGRLTVNLEGIPDVELAWRLRTGTDAIYPATLWLWMVTEAGEELLLAREFTVDSRSLIGLDVRPYRIGAAFLSVLALCMAFFLFLKTRRKQIGSLNN